MLSDLYASAATGFGLPWWAWAASGGTVALASAGLSRRSVAANRRRLHAAEQEAAASQTRLRTALNEAFTPLASHLGDLAAAGAGDQRTDLRGETIDRALLAAEHLIDGERARICWFELITGRQRTQRQRSLHPRRHVGRMEPPTTVFVEGTLAGDEVFAALDRGASRRHTDVEAAPPAGWDPAAGRSYRAFLSVPVTAGTECFGMFTLDSTDSADVTADDVARLTLLAQLTGAALASQPSARTVVLPAPTAAPVEAPRSRRSLPRPRAPRHVVP